MGSFYRLKALLTGKRELMPKYFVVIKWILLGFVFFCCTMTMISQIVFATILSDGDQESQKTEIVTFINIGATGFFCCFIVLGITNSIYLGTIVKMWTTMRHHAYLRKNEWLMVTKWVINFSFTICQFFSCYSIVTNLRSSIKPAATLALDV